MIKRLKGFKTRLRHYPISSCHENMFWKKQCFPRTYTQNARRSTEIGRLRCAGLAVWWTKGCLYPCFQLAAGQKAEATGAQTFGSYSSNRAPKWQNTGGNCKLEGRGQRPEGRVHNECVWIFIKHQFQIMSHRKGPFRCLWVAKRWSDHKNLKFQ